MDASRRLITVRFKNKSKADRDIELLYRQFIFYSCCHVNVGYSSLGREASDV